MSIGLYDKAVTDKIKSWILDPNLTVYYPDETSRIFTEIIDENKDQPLQLPLIAISRDRSIDIKITAKRPMSYRGKTFNASEYQADHLNAIPIVLRYQIDIYTRYRAEADEYVRNLIFQLINHPPIQIQLPYLGCNLLQESYMTLEQTIDDNSDIPERLIPGQFTRMTLRFRLDDANFYSYTTKAIPKITEIGIYVDEKNENAEHKENDGCIEVSEIVINDN